MNPQRTLVRARNRIVLIIRPLRASNHVSPPRAHLSARWNIDDSAIHVFEVRITSEIAIIDTVDWIIGVWGSDTLELALVRTVHGDLLKDSVACCASSEDCRGEDGLEPHIGSWMKRVIKLNGLSTVESTVGLYS
jgi:hypothetical protein